MDTSEQNDGDRGGTTSGLKVAAISAAISPVAAVGSLYATWAAARVHLGHAPRVELDSPLSISWTVDILFYLHLALLISLPLGLLAGLALVPSVLAPKQATAADTAVSWLLSLLLLGAVWGACLWVLKADPWKVSTWAWYID